MILRVRLVHVPTLLPFFDQILFLTGIFEVGGVAMAELILKG
jgi:hypothetical protein